MNRIYFLSSLPLIAVDLEKVEAISEDWVMFGAGKISTGGEKNAYDLRKVWRAYHEKRNDWQVLSGELQKNVCGLLKVIDGLQSQLMEKQNVIDAYAAGLKDTIISI